MAQLSSSPTIISYDGALKGTQLVDGTEWCFEGRTYDTNADEGIVLESVGEALQEPTEALVSQVRSLVFSSGEVTYTSQVLSAMATAYEQECEGGEGCDTVASMLREVARRVAVVEALTI